MSKPTVGDHLLARLREWGVDKVFAYPGDGINGILAAWGRADDQPQFVQARHEEMAAFEAVGYAKFTGRVGVCMATSGPGAIHLLNGLYDAKLDHVPVVAIVGQTTRSAMGGSYQQEVDLLSLFKDVAGDYVQMVTVPEQLPNVLDRAIRVALAERAPTAIIIPSDVQELEYSAPTHEFKMVPSSLGVELAHRGPGRRRGRAAPPTLLNAGQKVAILAGQGARGAARRARAGRRPARRGRRESPAGQGRALRRTAVRDRLDRPARHPAQLRDDDGLRHAAHRRLELPRTPSSCPSSARRGRVQIDLDGKHDRDALPVRGQPGRRRGSNPAGADPAAAAQGRPVLAGGRSSPRWPAGGRRWRPRRWSTPTRSTRCGCSASCPPRLPDDAIVAADSGSAANWYARQLRFRGHMRGSLSGNAGHDGPRRAVRDRREVRPPGPAGDRVRRRRRDADERPRRADHDQALLAGSGSDPRLIVAVLHNNDLNQVTWEMRAMEGAPKFTESQTLPDVDYAAFATGLGLRGSPSTSPTRSRPPGSRRWPRTGRPCWTCTPTRTCRRSRRTRPSSR